RSRDNSLAPIRGEFSSGTLFMVFKMDQKINPKQVLFHSERHETASAVHVPPQDSRQHAPTRNEIQGTFAHFWDCSIL
ncbi:MAG TPA: hypothetical protein DCE18_16235, partial [Syntrophobacteraceae bacterium]|nr:hypothetical protein [Syntrophobacteraceae bacterium]